MTTNYQTFTTDLALATLSLLATPDEGACSRICDLLTSGDASQLHRRAALRAARAIDPTSSSHAAHIRDTIRDNY
jgi:hypothetical protein